MKATFAAGCFWHVEHLFAETPGVTATRVGYTGGATADPSYRDVCSDTTGHAEAVQVEYDPSRISYGTLLDLFWNNHDPTTPNRQGPDVGSQYRSAIFCHDDSQLEQARDSMEALSKSNRHAKPIVTQVLPAAPFYEAEEYHQRYFKKMGAG